jgi:hypothetical protein
LDELGIWARALFNLNNVVEGLWCLTFFSFLFVLVSQTFIIVFDFIILAVFSADKSHLFEQVEPLSLLRANKEHHYIVSWRVLVYLVFLVSHSLHPF